MFDDVKKSIQWGQDTLTLETGKVARQADGSVIATLGETSVMANVTFAKEPKPGQDFFPLTVHYQEKYYAAGKVPGGFFKREARPTEKETLTARLIDRPIRPLFVPGFKNEVLVMCTCGKGRGMMLLVTGAPARPHRILAWGCGLRGECGAGADAPQLFFPRPLFA